LNLVLSNKEGKTLRRLEETVQRNVPGLQRREITGGCRKLHNEELHD
jgi:hypothetical protein